MSERTLTTYLAYLMALKGDADSANQIISNDIKKYTQVAIESILKRINEYAAKNLF
ncbi:hypothetical protein HLX67_24245 [Escherichia coli]|nr:hypothetical protein [Escherichia coli]